VVSYGQSLSGDRIDDVHRDVVVTIQRHFPTRVFVDVLGGDRASIRYEAFPRRSHYLDYMIIDRIISNAKSKSVRFASGLDPESNPRE